MSDYSDLIFLISAIVIYGVLVTNANKTMLKNDQIMSSSEIEYGAISVAQDILEEARWMKYSELNEDHLENLYNKSMFSDSVDIHALPQADCPTSQPCSVIDVTISSQYLTDNQNNSSVTLSLLKTDY